MGKCLVTKLNGVVDNNNLKKIGVLKIPIAPMSSSKTFIVRSVNGSNGKVTVTDKTNGIVKSVNVENKNSSSYTSYQVPNGGYVEISDKYFLNISACFSLIFFVPTSKLGRKISLNHFIQSTIPFCIVSLLLKPLYHIYIKSQ